MSVAVHALAVNVNLPANDGYLLSNFSGYKPPSAVCSMAGSNEENAHIFVMVSGGRQASVRILGGLFGATVGRYIIGSGTLRPREKPASLLRVNVTLHNDRILPRN